MLKRRVSIIVLVGLLNVQLVSAQVMSYQGQLSQLIDAGNRTAHYTYMALNADSGPLASAHMGQSGRLGSETQYTVPVRLALTTGGLAQNSCTAGRVCAEKLGNGDVVIFNYSFNSNSDPYQTVSTKLVYQKQSSGRYQQIAETQYHYNLVGELTRKAQQLSGQQTSSHSQYDMLSRLVHFTQTNGQSQSLQNATYIYDINTNMTDKASQNAHQKYGYNGLDQQTDADDIGQSYDQFGNQKNSMAGYHYQFNARNELVSENSEVLSEVENGYSYGYFPNGTRSNKAAGLKQRTTHGLHFYYSANDLVDTANNQGDMSHYLLAAQRINRFVTASDTKTALSSGQVSNMHYYLVGHNNMTNGLLSSANGAVQATTRYTPFGQKLPGLQLMPHQKAPQAYQIAADPIGYDGEQQDLEDGAVYLRSRYYQPVSDRFLSPDALSYSMKENNRYVYSMGDPLNRVDPMGQMSFGQIYNGLFASSMGLTVLGQILGTAGVGAGIVSTFFMAGLAGNMVATVLSAIGAKTENERIGYYISGAVALLMAFSLSDFLVPEERQAVVFGGANFLVNAGLGVGMPMMNHQKLTGHDYVGIGLYSIGTSLTSGLIVSSTVPESEMMLADDLVSKNGSLDFSVKSQSHETALTDENSVSPAQKRFYQRHAFTSVMLGAGRGAFFEALRLETLDGKNGHDVSLRSVGLGTLIGAVQGAIIYNGLYASNTAFEGRTGFWNKAGLFGSNYSALYGGAFGLPLAEKIFHVGT